MNPDDVMQKMQELQKELTDPNLPIGRWLEAAREAADVLPEAVELTRQVAQAAAAVAEQAEQATEAIEATSRMPEKARPSNEESQDLALPPRPPPPTDDDVPF